MVTALPLKNIPVGTSDAQRGTENRQRRHRLVRSAGASAQLMAKEGDYALLRLPSGEIRKVHVNCQATIGQVGNLEHENITMVKLANPVGSAFVLPIVA